MPTDNVQLSVRFQGRKDDIDRGLVRAIDEALASQTGLKREDVTFKEDQVYTVKIESPNVVEVGQGSSNSIDEAINSATKSGALNFGEAPIMATLERTAQVPYFTVPVTVRTLYPDQLETKRKASCFELASTYGNRFNQHPESVSFRVIKTSRVYSDDEKLPLGEIKDVLAEGRGMILENAVKDAQLERKQAKKVRTTIYEQTANVVIYGVPERSLARTSPVSASVAVGAGVGTSAVAARNRAVSPAGKEPAYLSSATNLM